MTLTADPGPSGLFIMPFEKFQHRLNQNCHCCFNQSWTFLSPGLIQGDQQSMKKGLYLGLGMIGPSWNVRIPGEHCIVCVDKSFFGLLMYIGSCCSGYYKRVQRKGGLPARRVFEMSWEDSFIVSGTYKAQVRVLQLLVALGFESKPGLAVGLEFSP